MSQKTIDRALDLLELDVRAKLAGRTYTSHTATICGCKVVASLHALKRRSGRPPLVWYCDNIELTRVELRHTLLRCENRVTYSVHINERQRNIIGGLLEKLRKDRRLDDDDEAAILASLFADLPAEETAHPNVLHGLCL
jgi:hypothetical protein